MPPVIQCLYVHSADQNQITPMNAIRKIWKIQTNQKHLTSRVILPKKNKAYTTMTIKSRVISWAAIRINLRHVDIENNSFSRWQILNEMHATIGREISNGWGWGETREKLQDILLISQLSKPTHIRTFSRKHKKLATHQAY